MTRIFISYKREDEPFATNLRQRLLNAGYEVWMDIFDIPKGAHWPDEIQKGLESSDVVLGLMTPRAMDSRNVKNEWDWAIVYEKRFIPLLIEKCVVHMNYVSLNYIDFTKGHDIAFASLETTLKSAPTPSTIPTDPYRDYLQKLYERINDYLARAIITRSERDEAEPIRLVSERTQGMVDALFEKRDEVDPLFAIGFGDEPSISNETFTDFNQAFEELEGRILLLGEPGAGKTITLLHFGRDAVVRRMQSTSAPLPILATIPTWDIRTTPPLIDWLSTSYGAPSNTADIIQQGKALLLLDGLDELGGERENPETKERIPDPRPRFMDALRSLPESNRVIVTCRVKDYEEIGQKIALNGALKLKALSDSQIHDYLRDLPELWEALQTDEQLRHVTRTPILLSYFAFGFKEATPEERQKLRDLSAKDGDEKFYELRDAIFERYVKGRYEHEARKTKSRGKTMKYSLDDIYKKLGESGAVRVAYTDPYNIQKSDPYNLGSFLLGTPDEEFTELAIHLHLIMLDYFDEIIVLPRFIHILLRNHFVYPYLIPRLNIQNTEIRSNVVEALGNLQDARAVKPLITVLGDKDENVRQHAVVALGKIGDRYVVEPLIATLKDSWWIRLCAIGALENIGDVRVVAPLIMVALRDKDETVRLRAVVALDFIRDERAIEALILMLSDIEEDVRIRATSALVNFGESAVEPLIAVLGDKDQDVRFHAITALFKIRNVRAIELLISALQDRAGKVRNRAADALTYIGTPEALEAVRHWRASQSGASGAQGDTE
jgi:hypothetical protein